MYAHCTKFKNIIKCKEYVSPHLDNYSWAFRKELIFMCIFPFKKLDNDIHMLKKYLLGNFAHIEQGSPGLLGTGLHCRKWMAGDPAKLHLPLLIARFATWIPLPPPHLWINCLPQIQSLVPNRLGTSNVEYQRPEYKHQ